MRKLIGWLAASIVLAAVGCGGGDGAPKDTLPPNISEVQVVPDKLIARGIQVSVQAKVTDEGGSGVKEVRVTVGYPDGSIHKPQVSKQGDIYNASFVAEWDDRNVGEVEIEIMAMDNGGNESSSKVKVRGAIGPPGKPSF